MANLDRPSGFKPVKHLNGSSWNGKANVYYVPASDGTALFIGDAVKSAGSADPTGKYPSVTQATAGANILGVIVGFGLQPEVMSNPDNPNMKYRAALTAMYVLVVVDPFVIFEIQEDNESDDLAITDVGLCTNIAVGSGSTTTGKSGMELDSSDSETDGYGQCKILQVANRPDNELGEHCKWEVLIVEHEMLANVDV
jgi:hypothetical protein